MLKNYWETEFNNKFDLYQSEGSETLYCQDDVIYFIRLNIIHKIIDDLPLMLNLSPTQKDLGIEKLKEKWL